MSFLDNLNAVLAERERQDEKWGEQHHPDGTGSARHIEAAETQRSITNERAKDGTLTWHDILAEEVCEAFAEYDPVKLVEELTQTIAVAFAWIEDIQHRQSLREPVREAFEDAA